MVRAKDIDGLLGGSDAPKNFPGVPGTSGPRTLISCFPIEQRLTLWHKGRTEYVLPKAEKGTYVQLTVEDTYSWCKNWSQSGFNLYQAPVPASAVADNMIKVWREGLLGTKDGLGPGILICAGADPTAEEIAKIEAMNTEYFRFLINEADALDRNNHGNDIHDLHRLAADWMGANDRAWAKPIEHVEMVACPSCQEKIRKGARKCRWCQEDLVKLAATLEREAKMAASRPGA